MALSAEQIAAQISHLEQQRRQIEEAIAALREAQRRLGDRLPRGESGGGCGH
ncbi:MAG: hypothetical protein L0Y50_06535 [Beijerinckiaceae bacterium]|nr:hypothetical protein [Beijerinckiaceae bacterium]